MQINKIIHRLFAGYSNSYLPDEPMNDKSMKTLLYKVRVHLIDAYSFDVIINSLLSFYIIDSNFPLFVTLTPPFVQSIVFN